MGWCVRVAGCHLGGEGGVCGFPLKMEQTCAKLEAQLEENRLTISSVQRDLVDKLQISKSALVGTIESFQAQRQRLADLQTNDDFSIFKSSLFLATRLTSAQAVLDWIIDTVEQNTSVKQLLQQKRIELAVPAVLKMKHVDCQCSLLDDYTKPYTVLIAESRELVLKSLGTLLAAAIDSIQEFQKLFKLALQFGVDSAFTCLVEPYRIPFQFHFYTQRPTNQLEHPEYYLDYLFKVYQSRSEFLTGVVDLLLNQISRETLALNDSTEPQDDAHGYFAKALVREFINPKFESTRDMLVHADLLALVLKQYDIFDTKLPEAGGICDLITGNQELWDAYILKQRTVLLDSVEELSTVTGDLYGQPRHLAQFRALLSGAVQENFTRNADIRDICFEMIDRYSLLNPAQRDSVQDAYLSLD